LNSIQLNDTHPSVAIPELLYQLVDKYSLEFSEAFDIVYRTFSYTNHTVLPEALEKWSVDLFGYLLPRHLELIYLINYIFLEKINKQYPGDSKRIANLSVIEETMPKMIRMANLCIISSHAVNGVAQIHTDFLKSSLFKEFNDFFPYKFINITNGVTPRRWIHCAFRELSDLLTEYYGNLDWLSDLSLLETLPSYIKSKNLTTEFINKFALSKLNAKRRLKEWVKENCNINIDESFMFDVQVKRIHEYKRQFMNCLYCIFRYMKIKEMKKEEREKVVKRVTFFGGKAAPGYLVAKNFIQLINLVSFVINNDPDTNEYFKVVFLPDYKVSIAQLSIPAADLSQHISTAGTEASGTSNMKFVMTGSLIIGTRDGANIEIAREIGEENIFFFGNDLKGVLDIRSKMKNTKNSYKPGDDLNKVFNYILEGRFGNVNFIKDYIIKIINGGDFYLVCHDFYSYIEAQKAVDEAYSDINEWYRKALISISRMGFFSSDRSILDYSESIWKLKPVEIPKPSFESSKRVVSSGCLKKLEINKDICKKSKSHGKIKADKISKSFETNRRIPDIPLEYNHNDTKSLPNKDEKNNPNKSNYQTDLGNYKLNT
jgi:starch phosphorylase